MLGFYHPGLFGHQDQMSVVCVYVCVLWVILSIMEQAQCCSIILIPLNLWRKMMMLFMMGKDLSPPGLTLMCLGY